MSSSQTTFEKHKKLIDTIVRKKNEGQTLYLVLGGYVNFVENKRGRTFFNHDNVFIIDKEACDDTCPFKDRYFQLDFLNPSSMLFFKKIKDCFNTVLFDWSVYKFLTFLPNPMGNVFRNNQIQSIFKIFFLIIKPGGRLIIDDPKMDYGIPPASYVEKKRKEAPNGIMPMNAIVKNYKRELGDRNLSWLTERLENSGFTNFTFVQNPNEITDSIVKQIYTEGITELLPVLIAEKPASSNGGKRKTQKSRKTRKNKFAKSK